jgi:hypothetical protein
LAKQKNNLIYVEILQVLWYFELLQITISGCSLQLDTTGKIQVGCLSKTLIFSSFKEYRHHVHAREILRQFFNFFFHVVFLMALP